MKRIAILGTVVAIVAALVALAAGSVFAQVAGPDWGFGRGGMMGGGYGPGGMMGRGGYGGYNGLGGQTGNNPQAPGPGWGAGPRGGWGPGGMMGGFGDGFGGMMGGWWNQGQPSGNPISMDQAEQSVRQYVANSGYQGLVLSEIMQFDNNFYAGFKEKDTGVNAIELLVDPYSGAVSPEIGPNMMWNTKYGHMGGFGGMMGGRFGWGWGGNNAPTADMPVNPDQAVQAANDYLAQALPGTTAKDPETFYGYYTLDTEKDGKTTGMLSVNGYTGQVWLHTWHGTFIDDKDFQE